MKRVIVYSVAIAALIFIGIYYYRNNVELMPIGVHAGGVHAGAKPILTSENGNTPLQVNSVAPSAALNIEKLDVYTLSGSEDYAALKAHFQVAADHGDPTARRIIAQIYEYCGFYHRPRNDYKETIEQLKKSNPNDVAKIANIDAQLSKRCATLDHGLPITYELLQTTWAKATEARDLVATLKAATQDQTLSGNFVDQLIERTLNSNDAGALFELGSLLAQNSNSVQYQNLSGPVINESAWQIAACRLGGADLCGPDSQIMSSFCLSGNCQFQNYEDMVRDAVPRSEQFRLDQAISQIETLIRQRNTKK